MFPAKKFGCDFAVKKVTTGSVTFGILAVNCSYRLLDFLSYVEDSFGFLWIGSITYFKYNMRHAKGQGKMQFWDGKFIVASKIYNYLFRGVLLASMFVLGKMGMLHYFQFLNGQ